LQFLKCDPTSCPNFVQSIWISEKGEHKLVNDCAPRRLTLMMQQVIQSNLALQKSNEELRNANSTLLSRFDKLLVGIARKTHSEIANG
jgi:hypothetical protein